MSYYALAEAANPWPGSRLTLYYERPTIELPTDGPIKDIRPGPRMRVIIEGEYEFVKRALDAATPTIRTIEKEIGGRPKVVSP